MSEEDGSDRAGPWLAANDRMAETEGGPLRLNLSFRTRLTIGLIAASLIPLAVFGAVLFVIDPAARDGTVGRLLLFVLVVAALLAVFLAYLLAADLTAPLRAIAAAVARTSAGDLSTPIDVPGEDELARLAESHNRLAADLQRRNLELGRLAEAIGAGSPGESPMSPATRRPKSCPPNGCSPSFRPSSPITAARGPSSSGWSICCAPARSAGPPSARSSACRARPPGSGSRSNCGPRSLDDDRFFLPDFAHFGVPEMREGSLTGPTGALQVRSGLEGRHAVSGEAQA